MTQAAILKRYIHHCKPNEENEKTLLITLIVDIILTLYPIGGTSIHLGSVILQ